MTTLRCCLQSGISGTSFIASGSVKYRICQMCRTYHHEVASYMSSRDAGMRNLEGEVINGGVSCDDEYKSAQVHVDIHISIQTTCRDIYILICASSPKRGGSMVLTDHIGHVLHESHLHRSHRTSHETRDHYNHGSVGATNILERSVYEPTAMYGS